MKLRSLFLGALVFCALPVAWSSAQVSLTVAVPPPPLRVYEQPPCPVDGYIWTPGYWAYADDYYWVPGAWVAPARIGFLWTPGYWGYGGGSYLFHDGYWGPTVGFYGGINYGYGYGGHGYYGGRWEGRSFRYNTAVSRVNTSVIHNTYVDRTVVNSARSRASFNGPGGVQARPNAAERAAMNAPHLAPRAGQLARRSGGARGAGRATAQAAAARRTAPAARAQRTAVRTSRHASGQGFGYGSPRRTSTYHGTRSYAAPRMRAAGRPAPAHAAAHAAAHAPARRAAPQEKKR